MSRNMYKGPTDKDIGVGRIECGMWGWVGWGRVMGKSWDNCNCMTIKKSKFKKRKIN